MPQEMRGHRSYVVAFGSLDIYDILLGDAHCMVERRNGERPGSSGSQAMRGPLLEGP